MARTVLVCLTLGLYACAQRPAGTDVILQWNQQTIATGGPQIQRTLAMVHIAMFDAVNAVQPRYTPYLTPAAPPLRVSVEAVAAGAAHGVLIRLFPAEQRTLDAALTRSLADIEDGQRESDGVRYGDIVADAVYRARLTDNILAPGPLFTSGAAPGDYELTAPEPPQPVNTNAQQWTPFALTSASQFRPAAPPALTSERYARDLAEVQRLGGIRSLDRTLDEEQIARWHTEQGHLQFNRIARTEAAVDGQDLVEHARLFALLNLALADAVTGVFEAKYTYRFWRPVTAIRHADADGNPLTEQDLVWSPLLPTPPHPEYPSAHSAVQAAGARVLTVHLGRFHSFRATSSAVPGVTRSYRNFSAFAEEGGRARILGGMHFRAAVQEGAKQGTQVADWVLDHYLLRVQR